MTGYRGDEKWDHTMNPAASNYLTCNVDKLVPLLEAPKEFTNKHIPHNQQMISIFHEKGIIQRVEKAYDTEPERDRSLWTLTPAAKERLKTRRDKDRPAELPCGHSGWQNERDVDGLTCKTCGAVHSKEIVRLLDS